MTDPHEAEARARYETDTAEAAIQEVARLRAALTAIAGFGDVNLSGEWEHSLRDIIRSMTDRAKEELRAFQQNGEPK